MTQAEFTAFYPQFDGFTPAVVMTTYIRQANDQEPGGNDIQDGHGSGHGLYSSGDTGNAAAAAGRGKDRSVYS